VTAERPFNIIKIGTDMPRDVLYDRINRRVDMMVEEGLEAEARAMYPKRHLNALQTVGYRELFEYFDGNCTFEEAVELVKRNSRRYAKRQLTWFRRDTNTAWFNPGELDAILAYIKDKR
jgi:tRNA dimethylallyltransferase